MICVNNKAVRMVLGTAQLGLDYGIANKNGKPDLNEALAIISTAWNEGVRFFDTAQAYGESESVLGRCFHLMKMDKSEEGPNIITKLNPNVNLMDINSVMHEIDASLNRISVEKLWGLMLHRESWLDIDRNELLETIGEIRYKCKIERFGVSVYSPEKAIAALDIDGIDIVQVPFNVFDQRARELDVFGFAESKGKTIFVRSVFLQGLLLMTPVQIPPKMVCCTAKLQEFRSLIEKNNLSPKLAALAFVMSKAPGAFFVLGVETQKQVKENIDLFRKADHTAIPDLTSLASHDPRLINPSSWN